MEDSEGQPAQTGLGHPLGSTREQDEAGQADERQGRGRVPPERHDPFASRDRAGGAKRTSGVVTRSTQTGRGAREGHTLGHPYGPASQVDDLHHSDYHHEEEQADQKEKGEDSVEII